jgi:hypothetical protein
MSSFRITLSAIALIASATASGGTYKPPRLADGRPDLQGNWDYVDATPLEAPHLFNPGTNLHQIVQTKDAIVLIAEWLNETRIIRLNSRHRPAAVTSWSGDSIGCWEGDTLIVETKHFSPADTGRLAAGVTFKISPHATVIERFTRVADDEINYVFTVEDPEYYTQPWKGETRFMRTADRILEYACHEANYSLIYIQQGARVRDAAQNDAAQN